MATRSTSITLTTPFNSSYPNVGTFSPHSTVAHFKSGDTCKVTVISASGENINGVGGTKADSPAGTQANLPSGQQFSSTNMTASENWAYIGRPITNGVFDSNGKIQWVVTSGSISCSPTTITQGGSFTVSTSSSGIPASSGSWTDRVNIRVYNSSGTLMHTGNGSYFNGGAMLQLTGGDSRSGTVSVAANTPAASGGTTYTVKASFYSSISETSGNNAYYGADNVFAQQTITVVPPDTTPDPFSLGADFTNVGVNATITTSSATITDIDAPADISVSGDGSPEYQIGNGGFTSNPASDAVSSGQTVTMRFTASSSAGTAHTATLTVGGVSDSVTATTASASDSTPLPFAFSPDTYENFALSTFQTTNPVTIEGIDTEATVTLTSTGNSPQAKWAKGENPSDSDFGTAAGTVVLNDKVRMKFRSSSVPSQSNTATLDVGGVSDTVSITTAAATSGEVTSEAPGGATYGLEIKNASGTVIFGPNMRSGHLVKTGNVAIPLNGTPEDIEAEGIEVGNQINLVLDIGIITTGTNVPAITRVNASGGNSGYFRIIYQLNTNVSIGANYRIIRY